MVFQHANEWSLDFQISKFPLKVCLYFLQAGDFILERRYNIKLKDSDKEITCRKNKLLINAIKSALKRLRVGGETGGRQLRGLVRSVSQTLFWFALINAQPQKIKRTTFLFRINKHASRETVRINREG